MKYIAIGIAVGLAIITGIFLFIKKFGHGELPDIDDVDPTRGFIVAMRPGVFYYLYEYAEEYLILEDSPILDIEKKIWTHPEYGFRCTQTFYMGNPEGSDNLAVFQIYSP